MSLIASRSMAIFQLHGSGHTRELGNPMSLKVILPLRGELNVLRIYKFYLLFNEQDKEDLGNICELHAINHVNYPLRLLVSL